MLTATQESLLNALSFALKGQSVSELSNDVIQEAQQQSILSLIANDAYAKLTFAKNYQLLWEQQQLKTVLKGIPFKVLKGSGASIYYPEPLRRTLGDIDIIVKREDYERAKATFVTNGYRPGGEDERHIHYYKNEIVIELHSHFATLQTLEQEQLLDNWILESPDENGQVGKFIFPMPPKELNGLILLTHINQHLEEGLGLRQIIDFVMYIKAELPDEKWLAFREKTDQIGLTTLTKVVGKLGKMHLGLPTSITWCDDASETTVEKLLEYCFECGNFGHKDPGNNAVRMVMSHGRGVKGFFRNLQKQGVSNWERLKEQPWLKPIAWLYQLCRYIKLGSKDMHLCELVQNMKASRKRNQLLDELGATRVALRK